MGDWKAVTRTDVASRLPLLAPSQRDTVAAQCNELRVPLEQFASEIESQCLAAGLSEPSHEILDTVRQALLRDAGGPRRRHEVHTKDTIGRLDPLAVGNGLRSPPSGSRRPGGAPVTPQRPTAGSTHASPSTPLVQSPVTEATLRYRDRQNKGKVEISLRNVDAALPSAVQMPKAPGAAPATAARRVEALLYPHLARHCRYMFEKLSDRAANLDDLLEQRTLEICEAHALGEAMHPTFARQSEFVTVGRICAEPMADGKGTFGDGSVHLEPSQRVGSGKRVRLNLTGLDRFSLFPGQVVGLKGVNTTGNLLTVTSIYPGAAAPLQRTPWSRVLEFNHEMARADGRAALGGAAMRIVVSAGPYTLDDNLDYEPLDDLLAAVVADPPDVVLLCGPFVDSEHPLLLSAGVSPDELLTHCVIARVSAAAAKCGASTQFIVVPSLDDVTHPFPLLPQPPLAQQSAGQPLPPPGSWGRDVLCYPNPACFSLNELVVGVGNADILLHLGEAMVQRRAAGEPLDVLAARVEHIIQQRSFYPLLPSHPSAPVETQQLPALELPVTPDILILPSQLACFVKVVGETVAINPGRLCKRKAGGTFARVTVFPIKKDAVGPDTAPTQEVPHRVHERVAVEVIRL